MRRPTIAVGLPPGERDAILQGLTAAEFGSVILESVGELPAVIEAGLPVGLAILDPTDDPVGFAASLAEMRAAGPIVPILVIVDQDQFDALSEGVALSGLTSLKSRF